MSIIQAIILGLVQGLSEFLPISSTAHLTLAGKYMGLIDLSNPERWTAFIAIIQLGTLASVLIYFANDIKEISKSFITDNFSRKKFSEQSDQSKMGWFVIIGTISIVIIGLGFKKIIEGVLTKNLTIIGCSLIGLAIILFIAERTAKLKRGVKDLTVKDAFLIGTAQALALIPGSSRSGTTITAGLFLGLKRETAARFSFLLSIPAVLASGLLELKQSFHYINSNDATSIVIATIVSGISGYFCISFLLKYLVSHNTNVFIIYRILLGAVILYIVYK
ncbi:MAG: undecaprenyl-diphosphatase UppP [Candidatus Kapaibacterium sp.]